MANAYRCTLTTKDYGILEAMLESARDRGDTIVPLLREKLATATIVFHDDIDPSIVTLNSRVLFRVNDGAQDDRVVVRGEERSVPGMTIPITIPRGLALLGLAAGEDMVVGRPGEPAERILVDAVAYQPEAARRFAGRESIGAPSGRPAARRFAGVVDLAARRPPAGGWRATTRKPDDDPDPSAA